MVNSAFTDDAISIYLQNNAITGTIPLELAKFDKLDLNLAGNDIEEIPNDLCHIAGWMQGNVGTVGNCSAILCPAETFNQFGRRSPGSPCLECSHLEDVIFLGQTRCENFTSERETLNSLYFATGGEFWNNNTRWQTEAPICSWDGVLCEDGDLQDTEGITTIRLEENGLSGTLPSEVWTLPSLRYLSVKGNPGLQVNFEGLANVADTLETLYLSGVRMSSLDGVSQATSLRKLHLTGNDLKGMSEQRDVARRTTTSRTCGDHLAYLHPDLFFFSPLRRHFPSRIIQTIRHSGVSVHRI
jgi:Leucine-rich repeat (LRR) protein